MVVSAAFNVIEPLAQQIEWEGGNPPIIKELLRHIGGTPSAQAKMFGRVEIQDKPDLTVGSAGAGASVFATGVKI